MVTGLSTCAMGRLLSRKRTRSGRDTKFADLVAVVYNFVCTGGSNSVVECDLAKVEVAGSNPVSRSIGKPRPMPGLFFVALR